MSVCRNVPTTLDSNMISLYDTLPIFPARLSRPPRCNPPESASRGSRFSPSTIALASRPVQLSAVMATELVDLLEREGVELRSEEHTSELQSLTNLVCRLLLEKKN